MNSNATIPATSGRRSILSLRKSATRLLREALIRYLAHCETMADAQLAAFHLFRR